MKNLKSNQLASLFTLLFLFVCITMNAQMHPPIAEAKTDKEVTVSEDYFFHSQFDKKHNFKLEKMLTKKLGKRSGLSNKDTKVWTRFNGKKVDGLQVSVSKGELQIRYDHSGGADLVAGLKELLGDITGLIYAKDGTFRLEVKGTL